MRLLHHHEAAIEAEGLVKHFGDVRAVDGVDLRVARGTVLGVLGPNGAGKTTTMRMLATLVAPDAGTARVAGLDVVTDAHALRGRIQTYSGATRRPLSLAAALAARPAVLFLDEPTTGLDPRSRLMMWETIAELAGAGTTVLLATQDLGEADRLADRIALIDHGRVVAEGTPDELKARVGGARVEVELAYPEAAYAASVALRDLADDGRPVVQGTTIRLTVRHGRGAVAEAARRLDAEGVRVDDIALRRPTLDDAFLALTGVPAGPPAAAALAAAR